jgi:uncharacterized protein YfaS (alpha-2-macroglobulin family)
MGGWSSTFDTAWAVMGMTEALKGTGDLQANFSFTATLNGKPLANGQAGGGNDLTAVTASVPLTDLKPAEPNELQISRTAGSGRLYYRAYLNVNRPVDTAPPVENGLSITRAYTLSGPNCQKSQCPPVTTVKMGGQSQLLTVRLTLTLPHDVSNLVVEDMIPAGTEILNAQLKTSQQNAAEVMNNPEYDPLDPFAQGWGWWLFHDPQIFDNHIRWAVDSLAAGTYQLTYQLVVLQPGEYRVIPARAFEYYFPEVQGSSAGTILTIQP